MTKSGAAAPIASLPTGVRPCPICGKPATARHHPFCSGRCANIDLGRWLKGNYRVETDEPADDNSEASEP